MAIKVWNEKALRAGGLWSVLLYQFIDSIREAERCG